MTREEEKIQPSLLAVGLEAGGRRRQDEDGVGDEDHDLGEDVCD